MEIVALIGVQVLYLLALINPISKVSILAVQPDADPQRDLTATITKSSLAAVGILLIAMIGGHFVLEKVFHIDLYSLRLAGGIVLFWVGFNALRKGVFFEHDAQARFEDMAVAPLACPMIAGPATITACIALRAHDGILGPAIAMLIAVAINHGFMLSARFLGGLLKHYNLMGALIRLTGLIVMTMGAQMALDGITDWRAVPAPRRNGPDLRQTDPPRESAFPNTNTSLSPATRRATLPAFVAEDHFGGVDPSWPPAPRFRTSPPAFLAIAAFRSVAPAEDSTKPDSPRGESILPPARRPVPAGTQG